MTKEGYANLTLILSIVAAGLALSAAVIEYVRRGDVRIALIAAGIFLLALGFGAKSRVAK
ncbi:MAG: hypothetical protein H0V18_18795 [Pyrinomonadaceae bacterium]|jgi:4-amino-4-deoxy-L-arabinose transferase-like glycosyltransferase|nr:hypothetical protein [Pyrinomonadaceae bacterium]